MLTPTLPLIHFTTSPVLVHTEFDPWLESGVLSSLDVEFAALIRRLAPHDDPLVATTAGLVSRATQAGHVCLDLARQNAWRLVDNVGNEPNVVFPAVETWCNTLRESSLVGDGTLPTPLVMVGSRVYLHRYWAYEQRLQRNLQQRLATNDVVLEEGTRKQLARLFATSSAGDLQRRAALLASVHRFCVISGGPGTGKTTTIAKVLLLLAEQFAARGEHLRLMLLAPTGKAATRLSETLTASLQSLDSPSSTLLDVTPATIHRALGYQPRSPTRFRHDVSNPLPVNVVIVDEAAMVDLALMTKLCEAVPLTSHLILLGDRDQLASVEAGAVFGDLFNPGGRQVYSAAFYRQLESLGDSPEVASHPLPPIADCTIHLEKSYRYSDDGGIAQLARAIRAGDVSAAFQAISSPDIHFIELPGDSTLDQTSEEALRRCVSEGFAPLRGAHTPGERLHALSLFRLLSPHRKGVLGVEGLNELAERVCLPVQQRLHDRVYAGLPILINENDYHAELYNGDVGILDHGRNGKLAAFFPGVEGLRQLGLARLPSYSTVYAMTIHKSQGSEFERVAVVLPHQSSPLLSRELLYTGVTRAKRRVILVASRDSLRTAIERRVERSSGLRETLWGG